MNILKLFIFCALFSLILTSCLYVESNDKNGGVLLNQDVLSSILKDMEDRENSLLAEDGDVFWTPSGSIWHASYECSYLSNSKEIYHGTVEEAMLDGKERACSRCFANDEDAVYQALENNPIIDGDVFFTRENNMWHSHINCSKLIGADKIYNSSIEKAKSLGKTDACECNNK